MLALELLNKLAKGIQKRMDVIKAVNGWYTNIKSIELSIKYLAIVRFSQIVNSFNFAYLIG